MAGTELHRASNTAQRHLLHVLPSFKIGGAQVRLATIANHLGRRHRHTILAIDGAFDCDARLEPSVDRAVAGTDTTSRNIIARLLGIRKRISAIAPDLLLTYNWGAIEWALANRLWPICAHIHFEDGFGAEEADRQLRRRVLIRRAALSGNTRVVVPSLALRNMARAGWKLAESRIVFIPNGVDCGRFAVSPDPQYQARLKADPETLLVGTVAALRPEKNVARLIRAIVPLVGRFKLRLVIAGDGAERPRLEALAGTLGVSDHVVFLGTVAGAERILPLLDVFTLSSDTEQMPLTLLEAMAAGLPVVAVDVGDIRMMLPPEGRRLVVARDDQESFTGAFAELLGSHELRRDLGRRNRAHVRASYSIDTMLATYDRLLS
jgi:glycosyltransferase involved in cell wall biosynthesis